MVVILAMVVLVSHLDHRRRRFVTQWKSANSVVGDALKLSHGSGIPVENFAG